MKARNFFIIAIIILFVVYFPIKLNHILIKKSNKVSVQYDEMLTSSCSDATRELLYSADSYSNEMTAENDKVDYRNINLNLNKSLQRFYDSLYLNLNIENNSSEQDSIRNKIPIKIVTAYDGYYISYFKGDGQGEQWTQLKPYSLVEDNLVINFTLSDYVEVTNTETKQTLKGKRKDFESKYPDSCLKDEKSFTEVRSQVINSNIREDLNYYTFYSNDLAQRLNWHLTYNIPYWGDRAIDSVSFIAFYQGVAFQGVDKVYNSYGFSAAKIKKDRSIYGYEINGKKYYSEVKHDNSTYFENEIEAAKKGYEPDLQNR